MSRSLYERSTKSVHHRTWICFELPSQSAADRGLTCHTPSSFAYLRTAISITSVMVMPYASATRWRMSRPSLDSRTFVCLLSLLGAIPMAFYHEAKDYFRQAEDMLRGIRTGDNRCRRQTGEGSRGAARLSRHEADRCKHSSQSVIFGSGRELNGQSTGGGRSTKTGTG